MSELCGIAKKHGTDKVSHGYTVHYDHWFSHLREQPVTLLEIGTYQGASIKTWLEYFPQAQVCAVDVLSERLSLLDGMGRVHPVCLNQGKRDEWQSFLVGNPELQFDIVIDDGNHMPQSQWVSFESLFPRLKPGGIYIVEDLHPHYAFINGRHALIDALGSLINAKVYSQQPVDVQFIGKMVAIRKEDS